MLEPSPNQISQNVRDFVQKMNKNYQKSWPFFKENNERKNWGRIAKDHLPSCPLPLYKQLVNIKTRPSLNLFFVDKLWFRTNKTYHHVKGLPKSEGLHE